MQKTPSFSMYSHLIIDLFTPPSTVRPRTGVDNMAATTHTRVIVTDGCRRSMWTTTAAPNAQRHASTFTRPPKLALKRTQSTLVGRVGPTQNHANIVTQMCSADIATAAAAALMIVPLGAPEVHAACAQQPHRWSAVRASDIARGRGHGQAYGWAYLRAHRLSSRSGRSSEPGCEAGTHPWDGHGSTLSSALRHGHGERHEQRCR